MTLLISRNCPYNFILGHHRVLALKMYIFVFQFLALDIAVAHTSDHRAFEKCILVTFIVKNLVGWSNVFISPWLK